MLQINDNHPPPSFALFELGFRPFFTLAAVFAVFAMLFWMLLYHFANLQPAIALGSVTWHAHEMIYGYSMAVVAGFLLTAVGNWTGLQTWKNEKLAVLAAGWLGARLLLLMPAENLLLVTAIIDNLFIAALLFSLAVPVIQKRMWQQSGILFKVLLLLVTNLYFYAGALGYSEQGIHIGLYGGLYLIIALLFMMLRRVVPFFIERGTNAAFTPRNSRLLDISSLILFTLWAIIDIFFTADNLLAVLSLSLFILHTIRLQGWYTREIFSRPLLWSLYTGYALLTLGFLLQALSVWLVLPASLSLHTFAVGGIGVMTLAMMSRVTLGHTGRDISLPPRFTSLVFILITAAFVFRVVMPAFDMQHYVTWMSISQATWVLAFLLFAFIYIPQLIKPRIDGRRG